jgi:hypothetical protein
MINRITALLEALTAADLEATRPADLERFAALCRHWGNLADLSREEQNGRGQIGGRPQLVASAVPTGRYHPHSKP